MLIVDKFSYIMQVRMLSFGGRSWVDHEDLVDVGPTFAIVGVWQCFVLCPLGKYAIFGYI